MRRFLVMAGFVFVFIGGSAFACSAGNTGSTGPLSLSGAVTGQFTGASGDCGSMQGKVNGKDVTIFMNGSTVQVLLNGQTYSGSGVTITNNKSADFHATAKTSDGSGTITLTGNIDCGSMH
jgi:hypothetical protein